MKKSYLFLTEILLLTFILAGCECGPGIPEEPIDRPEPELPPPSPPTPPPSTTQDEYFQLEGNNLVYFDGKNKYYLIKGKVESVKFEKVKGDGNSYYISVNLKLKDGQIITNLDSIIALRNINRTVNSGTSSGGSVDPGGGTSPPPNFEPIEPPEVGPVIPPY
ncbi:MAG: hypothetical protein NC926_04640 [Candidatus Omnitrophica bacterium]|nr:hypothetical protein [Candidatus Omnitrophota bacterium]MCM8807228.1 hypothetical protein [Candidatus Omnitrophota bacterium]